MPRDSAFNTNAPNAGGRFPPGTRVTCVFRLYRKLSAPGLGDMAGGTSVLAPYLKPVNDIIRTGRQFIENDLLGAFTGRVLEHEYKFVLLLDRLEVSPEVRTHFHYLREGYFLDTPVQNAMGLRHWRMAGTTFRTPAQVDGVSVDGDAAVKEFCELVEDYFFPRNGRLTSEYELYWINLLNAVSAEDPIGEREWLIHPLRNAPRITQMARRPFLRQFSFDFAGLQSNRDKAKAENGFLDGLLSGSFLGQLLHKLGLDGVTAAIQDVFGTIDEARAFLEDVANVASAVNDFVQGVVDFINISFGKIRALLTETQTIVGRVQEGIDLAKQIPDITEQDFDLLSQSFPGLVDSPDAGVICQDELQRVRDFLLTLAAQPESFSSPATAAVPETRSVAIQPNQTIEEIAKQFDTPVETLIALNDLQYPWVDARPRPDVQKAAAQAQLASVQARAADLTTALAAARLAAANNDPSYSPAEWRANIASIEQQVNATTATAARLQREIATQATLAATAPPVVGVLYAGDTIRVPQPHSSLLTPPSILRLNPPVRALIAAITGGAATEEDRLFGLDLALNENGDLVWDATRGDLALERGLQHMANVQVRYVLLPLGALRFAPPVGNYAWENVGGWQGQASTDLLAYAIYRTLVQDPRVAQVNRIRAETKGGVARLLHDVELINGSILPELRVPVP